MTSFFSKIKDFLSSKPKRWTLGSLLVIFIIFLWLNGTSSNTNDKVYRIGEDDHWYSLNLMGKEKNLTALSKILLNQIAEKEDFRFSLVTAPPATLEARLNAGELDAIISPMNPSPYLEDKYVFSDSFFLMGPVLVVPQGSEVDTWQETAYKVIGVLNESASALELEQEFQLRLQLYDNPLKALSDLNAGRIDGVVIPALPAYIYVNTFYPKQLKIATSPLNKEGFRLVALKSERSEELIKEFNKGLNSLKASQGFQDLLDEWGFVNPEQKE